MTEFKRSPSKVWWGNDSLECSDISMSPGSQDSGFSDVETSPNNHKSLQRIPETSATSQRIPKEIFKQLTSENFKENLSANYKEKLTPEKVNFGNGRRAKSEIIHHPTRTVTPKSEPVRKLRFFKHSPKVSRNLFTTKQSECKNTIETNQYSKEVQDTRSTFLNTSEEATVADSYSWCTDKSEDSFETYATKSLPVFRSCTENILVAKNNSLPAGLNYGDGNKGVGGFDSSFSSDCDSELECLFNGRLDFPRHTSTPKTDPDLKMGQRTKVPMNLFLKYQNGRVPPIPTNDSGPDNEAVKIWMEEARQSCEQECMTTLQSKSIAGELNQKVSQVAGRLTATIRNAISQSRWIESEYRNLNSETKHINPLIQSLTGNIIDYVKTHTSEISSSILKLCDKIRVSQSENSLKLISTLFMAWEDIRQETLTREVKKLMNTLENPTSELELRATITGITSIALRNEELIEIFTRASIIPILLILCEKCEGSSIRSLILRALSTMCCSSSAVRHFEKFSGVQIVSDTLGEDSRPEPERSEAVALLAQVTAPWLEDNHSVKGLQEYSRKLVKSLTKFSSSTKCCQNLLLCAAALANLSTMDSKTIKYMLHNKTAAIVLEAIRKRGPMVSMHLLEQVATLIANMSASEEARKHLTEIKIPGVLLCFLKTKYVGEDVERRLQQKSIIALSRLCGERDAAIQLVELGGVDKLVKMCRERSERYDSDAVLVAALATLRKIADTCGSEVLSVQDAQELVEPKLLDSFLTYSSQNESYV